MISIVIISVMKVMLDAYVNLFMIGLIISLAIVTPGHRARPQVEIPLPNIDVGVLNGILEGYREGVDNLFNSKPLEKLKDSGCLTSTLGGKSGVKKEGHLIIGTNCDDEIKGDSDDEVIYSLSGLDRVFAGDGNDIIFGGSGDTMLFGEQGNDIIMSRGATNLANGGLGVDILIGGPGNNHLVGGDGNDELIGGSGTTIMDGGPGTDHFDCGPNSVVRDYNPDNGDTVSEKCRIINSY